MHETRAKAARKAGSVMRIRGRRDHERKRERSQDDPRASRFDRIAWGSAMRAPTNDLDRRTMFD
jgi:hypothetical protein